MNFEWIAQRLPVMSFRECFDSASPPKEQTVSHALPGCTDELELRPHTWEDGRDQ